MPGPARVVPPGPSTVDLHSHTIQSDGLLEPIELVRAADAAGVRLFAITDHDTVSGVRELLRSNAEPLPSGIELIPGVEINAITAGGGGAPADEDEVHIIGLGVDTTDEAFEAVLGDQRAERRRRFARIVERLRDLGMPIDAHLERSDPSDEHALGRPTAARALVRAGHASDVEDAFTRWLAKGAPAFVPRTGLDPVTAIRAIRAARGLPVLAHYWAAAERIGRVRELADAGLAGIEVHHWSFDQPTVAAVGAVARELRLLSSGGTDYHGDLGTYGEVHAGLWVPPEVGDGIRTALALR